MNVGELFVNLGVKGTDKTVGALSSVKKGLGETASMSLEAKAGIVAAMYALERLFAASGAVGTGLTNFNSVLGVSAQTLQKYQYAARQMGVSNQEVEGSFKSLQSTMTKTLLNGEAPKGLARLAQLTGGIQQGDLLKFQQNPELLIQKLQQYAQKESNAGLRNETLKSFGLGDGMIAALSRGAFNQKALNRAPTYSDKELGALDRANIAWSNLGNKIEMAIGHFNAAHGGQLVKDISKITDQVLKLTEAFIKLAEKLHLFQGIAQVFEGWSQIFGATTKGIDAVSGAAQDPKKREKLGEDTSSFFKALPGLLQASGNMFLGHAATLPTTTDIAVPRLHPQAGGGGGEQNISINQTLNFQHDGKDHKKTSDSVKKAVQDSYREMSAQGQGS